MTEPLTPPDCDLQDFPFMPLHVARLRDSDLAAEANPEACWYAVLLWSASWHQIPAASLPDNETILARLCGLGRDLKTFRKHRDEAMRGFVKCSDGRLYHPVVAEQALESWVKRQAYQERKAARHEIAKKAADARWSRMQEQPEGTASRNAEAMHEASGEHASCIDDAMLKGTGTGTGILKKEANASSVAEATKPTKAKVRTYSEAFEAAWRAYPHHKGRSSKPNAQAVFDRLPVDERAGMVAAIQRFVPNVGEVCGGKGAPDMAVWLKDGKHLNWLADPAEARPDFDGPPELLASVAIAMGDDFAQKWVRPCHWRAADRTLVARNTFGAKKLTTELAGWLAETKVKVAVVTAEAPPLQQEAA